MNAKIAFKTVLYHKRGRKKEKKSCNSLHSSGDFDNIQRKIQVSFINFLISLANDAIKTLIGKQCKFYFKDIMYKYKKKANCYGLICWKIMTFLSNFVEIFFLTI